MSSNQKFKYWPSNGQLGSTKFTMPTTADEWPQGDALVGNFVYDKGKLVDFVDTKALIANSSKTTTFPYDYVNISLPSIAEGEMTYNYDQCTYVVLNGEVLKGDVPTNEVLDIITKKYTGCKTVDDIKAVDPNYLTNDIVNGVWKEGLGDLEQGGKEWWHEGMFYKCTALTSFTSDLSSLTHAKSMFHSCSNLKSFNSDLPSLISGYEMFFYCTNLKSFSSDMPSLISGYRMFPSCSNLTSFISDLSNMTNGEHMFYECTKLESFNSDLSSLTNGEGMFKDCYLNTASVQNIADTIKNFVQSEDCGPNILMKIHIGIGNSYPNWQEIEAFNKMVAKGWTVYVNGSQFSSSSCATCCASLNTLDETDGEFVAPIPFWAKPVPADEQHAQYVDSEGNFYNILGAQFIYGDDLSTYGMFTSLEDAAANMRLKKIGEEEIETA